MPARGHAANEHAGVFRVALHAHAIAEDGAAGVRTGGIDGEDADGSSGPTQLRRQPIDQRALAGARADRSRR